MRQTLTLRNQSILIAEITTDETALNVLDGDYDMTITRALAINQYYNLEQYSDEQLTQIKIGVVNG